MVVTEEWANLVAPDAPWVNAVRTALGPVKHAIINSHPSISSFFGGVDALANDLLTFYAPELPPEARQNSDLPLMDGKDALMFITGYLFVVCLSLLFLKGNTPEQARAQKNQKTIASKLGPVFIFQAVYNVAQVVACGFVVLRVLDVLRIEKYSLLCNKFNVVNSRMAHVTWFFYMLKYVDLLDTAFMILRGNLRQVTFLHVFHHSSVIYIFWINASVGYDGEIYFVVLLNAFVHVVMYAYYFMASFNIPLARMMKSCVTQLQMVQFLAMVGHGVYHIFFHQSCHYPVRITFGYLVYVVSLFFLFKDFSNKTYKRTEELQKQKAV